MKAELLALRDDLEFCIALGITELEVESDSQVIVHAVVTNHARSDVLQ